MILWTKRQKARALLAASLYEPLNDGDRRELDAALVRDARLRGDAVGLEQVRRNVHLESPEFTGDLAPLIRARLMEATPSRHGRLSARWMSATALSLLAASVALFFVVGVPVGPGQRNVAIQAKGASVTTPMDQAVSRANMLLASHKPAEAQVVLAEALNAAPGDAAGGAAQELLADLEFNVFHRYPEAYAAYDRLRTQYPQTFMASQDCIRRFNLLDEARRAEYAPMYALDAIRRQPANAFEQCERLMAQYPDSMVAMAAMNEMRNLVAGAEASDGPSRVLALERVRNRCSDPAAVAQVTLALGNACRDDLCDAHRAEDFYTQAAASGHYAVATRAQEALARLVVEAP